MLVNMPRTEANKRYAEYNFIGLKTVRKHSKNPNTNKEYTQKELADAVGCSHSSIVQYEKGEYPPPADVVEKIAKVFGFTLPQLLSRLDTKKPEASSKPVDTVKRKTIPKFHHSYRPRNFPFPDGILLENQDFTEAPASLRNVPNAYAVVVTSDHMEPRYRIGDVLFVNPDEEPLIGDDVVLRFKYRNRSVGVVREVINRDAIPSVALMTARQKQELIYQKLSSADEHVDSNTLQKLFNDNADKIVIDTYETETEQSDNDEDILDIRAHVIVGTERARGEREPINYVLEAEGATFNFEMGSPTMTVHRGDKSQS